MKPKIDTYRLGDKTAERYCIEADEASRRMMHILGLCPECAGDLHEVEGKDVCVVCKLEHDAVMG